MEDLIAWRLGVKPDRWDFKRGTQSATLTAGPAALGLDTLPTEVVQLSVLGC